MLATLYVTSHPRAPFLVLYTDPLQRTASGRAKRIPKRFADKEKAEAYRDDLNKRMAVVGTSGLVFDNQLRAQALAAKEMLAAAGISEGIDAIVARYVREHPLTVGATADAKETLQQFLDQKRYIENKSGETIDDLEKRISRWLRSESIVVMADITEAKVDALLLRKGISVKSRLNDINACASFCAWSAKKRKLAADPFGDVDRPVIERTRPRAWTNEDAKKILAAAQSYRGGYWMRAMVVTLFAGVRPSEAKQAQIRMETPACVRVEGGKLRGRANRIVPLSANARAWLRMAPAETPLKFSVRGRQTIAKLSGVKWWVDAPRHTFISNRLALINDQAKVAMEAGNSPDIIFRHYAALRTAKEAGEFWGLRPVTKTTKKTA